MNGNSDTLSSTNIMGSSAYAFFLNIIVLDIIAPHPTTPSAADGETPSDATEATAPAAPATSTTADDDAGAPAASSTVAEKTEPPKVVPTEQQKFTFDLAPGADLERNTAAILKKSLQGLDKSLRFNMRGLTKKSTEVANKAGAFVSTKTMEAGAFVSHKTQDVGSFVAKKTMVPRALSALNRSLPDLELFAKDLDLTIGKRFQQGKVIVLHVSLKTSGMANYVQEVKGQEASEKYRATMETLSALSATETMACLEREMLAQVRLGLMDKLSDLLVTAMKEKESGLEVECIGLEEAEEARWLFNFMEFQAQMK